MYFYPVVYAVMRRSKTHRVLCVKNEPVLQNTEKSKRINKINQKSAHTKNMHMIYGWL